MTKKKQRRKLAKFFTTQCLPMGARSILANALVKSDFMIHEAEGIVKQNAGENPTKAQKAALGAFEWKEEWGHRDCCGHYGKLEVCGMDGFDLEKIANSPAPPPTPKGTAPNPPKNPKRKRERLKVWALFSTFEDRVMEYSFTELEGLYQWVDFEKEAGSKKIANLLNAVAKLQSRLEQGKFQDRVPVKNWQTNGHLCWLLEHDYGQIEIYIKEKEVV